MNFRSVLSCVMITFCLWVSFDYCRFIELDYTPMESGIMVSMRQSRGFLTPKSPEHHCRSALHHPFCLVLFFFLFFSSLFFVLCVALVSMDSNHSTTARCPCKIQLFWFYWGFKARIAYVCHSWRWFHVCGVQSEPSLDGSAVNFCLFSCQFVSHNWFMMEIYHDLSSVPQHIIQLFVLLCNLCFQFYVSWVSFLLYIHKKCSPPSWQVDYV